MIPLLKSILHALLWDELAVRRWFRGLMLTMAVSGVGFADQIAALIHTPGWVTGIKLASLACALIAGATSVGQKNPPTAAPPGSPAP